MLTIEQAFGVMQEVIDRRLKGQHYSFSMCDWERTFTLSRFDISVIIDFDPKDSIEFWHQKATILCEIAEKVMRSQ